MTTAEIIMDEINFDLGMYKEFRTLWTTANNETDREYYFGAAKRSFNRVAAKCDLAQALGYDVVFDEERTKVLAVYQTDFDD